MIIRPQLKTHWIHSQNPLTVSLLDIEKVILRFPLDVFDFSFSKSSNLIKSLSQKPQLSIETQPPLDEIEEASSRRHTLAKDLFWGVFGDFNFLDTIKWPSIFDQIARSVVFELSDGRWVSLVGCHRIPNWPTFLNPQYYFHDRSCLWEKALSEAGPHYHRFVSANYRTQNKADLDKLLLVIFEILAWSIQRKRQCNDLEVCYLDEENKIWQLSDLELEPDPHWIVRFKSLQSQNRFNSEVGAQLFEKEPSKEQIEKKNKPGVGFLKPSIPLLNQFFDQPALPHEFPLRRTSHLSRAEDINYFIKNLKQNIHHIEIDLEQIKKLDEKQSSFVLSVDERQNLLNLSLRRNLDSKEIAPEFGFSSELKDLMLPLMGSIESFMQIDRKEAAAANPLYRSNELSLLRHSGVSLFCYLETINFKLGLPTTQGEIYQVDQSEEFYQYLEKTAMGLLGKYGESFDQSISKDGQKFFRKYLDKLKALVSEKHLFRLNSNHELCLYHHSEFWPLWIIRFIILHQVEITQGKVFSKVKSALGEKFPLEMAQLFQTQNRPLNIELLGPLGRAMPLLFELSDQGLILEINGQVVQDGSDAFNFSFEIGDPKETDRLGLFELDPVVFFEGVRIVPQSLNLNISQGAYGYIEYRGQVYRIRKDKIPPLRSLQVFWNRLKGIKKEGQRNKFGENVYQLPRAFALEVLMLRQRGISVQATGEWKEIFDFFDNELGQKSLQVSSEIKEKLLPHQSQGAQWLSDLYRLRLGAILADEMGLGKTFQLLSFFQSLYENNKLGLNLVVVPTSVLYNWIDEKNKFTPDLPLTLYDPSMKSIPLEDWSSEPKIVLTTYGHLVESTDFFTQINWNCAVFDEAQNLKNILSQRSVAARKIKAQFKVGLTGTPLENNYLEFYSLCDLVVPGALGDIDDFRSRFNNLSINPQLISDLKQVVKPLLLRRTKKQIKLELPEKIIQDVKLPFNSEQKEIYKKVALSYSQQVDQLIQQQGEKKSQIAMFAALMRLRQICSDPNAVPGVNMQETPVKVEHFLESVVEHMEAGESVLVFTQFLSTLNRLGLELEKLNIPYQKLHGQVPAKDRSALIKEFSQSEKPQVLLMTLKTGGVGLNLTKASVVYHLEPWWNPAVENQATDRAYRMGQTKNVKVFNLLIEGSLEERMVELKRRKSQIFDRLFDDNETADTSNLEKAGLTQEDFKFLISSN